MADFEPPALPQMGTASVARQLRPEDRPPTEPDDRGGARAAILLATAAVIAWAGWALLMARFPQPFAQPLLRGVVRVAVLLVPSLAYAWWAKGRGNDLFALRHNAARGALVGAVVGLIGAAIIIVTRPGSPQDVLAMLRLPVGPATWINAIVGSPLGEELLFRAVLLTQLSRVSGPTRAVVGSTAGFVLFHLPIWVFVDHLSGTTLLAAVGGITLYGLGFALLFLRSGSLWSALIPHWLNNLLVSSFT